MLREPHCIDRVYICFCSTTVCFVHVLDQTVCRECVCARVASIKVKQSLTAFPFSLLPLFSCLYNYKQINEMFYTISNNFRLLICYLEVYLI